MKRKKRKIQKRITAGLLAAVMVVTLPGMENLKVHAEQGKTETDHSVKTLIVSTTEENFDKLGAEECTAAGDGLYALSYPDEQSTESAYNAYGEMDGISFADINSVVTVQTEETQEDIHQKENDSQSGDEQEKAGSGAEDGEREDSIKTKKEDVTEKEESLEETEKQGDEQDIRQTEDADADGKKPTAEQEEKEDSTAEAVKNTATASAETEPEQQAEQKAEDGILRVALVDTGIKPDTGNLASCITDTGINVSESGEAGSTMDDNGHGTAMAQILVSALEENGTDSDHVKILPIKAMDASGSGTILTAYQGMKAAMELDADIICLGFSGKGDSRLLEQAVDEAYEKGITVVAPAGNAGEDISAYVPGCLERAVIAGNAKNKAEAGNSNHGETVDFAAYGTKDVLSLTGEAQTVQGTSVACAYVAGVAASIGKGLSCEEMESELVKRAEPAEDEALKPYFGKGLIGEVPEAEKEAEQIQDDGLQKDVHTYGAVSSDTDATFVYGEDPFGNGYSQGYIRNRSSEDIIRVSSGIKIKKGSEINADLSPNSDFYDKKYYTGNNTAKSSYIDYRKAARYVDDKGDPVWLDMRVYISTDNADHSWTMVTDKLNLHHTYNTPQKTTLEFHFYEDGTLETKHPAEVDFKGVLRITDLDTYEGICFYSGYNRFFRSKGSYVKYVASGNQNSGNVNNPFSQNTEKKASHPYFFGTRISNDTNYVDDANKQNVWVEVNSTASSPFKYVYATKNDVRGSQLFYTGTSIEYYIDKVKKDTFYCVPYGWYILVNTSKVSGQKKGYTVDGWYTSNSYKKRASSGTAGTDTIKIYGKYVPNTYNVAYNGNGNTGGSTDNSTHTYGTAKNLEKNGFERKFTVTFYDNYSDDPPEDKTVSSTFQNWNKKKDGSGTSYSDQQSVKNLTTTNKGTVNLYAQWKDDTVTLPSLTRTGYDFLGWNTDKSQADAGTIKSGYTAGASVTVSSDMTLYAVWKEKNYTITYEANGGSGTMEKDVKKYGETYTIKKNAFLRLGYDFVGWSTTKDGGADADYAPGEEYDTNADLTLYAQWRENFKAAYIGNGQTKGSDFIDEGENKSGYSEDADYIFDGNTKKTGGEENITLAYTLEQASSEESLKTAGEQFEREETVTYKDSETGEDVEQKITGTVVGWSMEKNIIPNQMNNDNSYLLDMDISGKKIMEAATNENAITYNTPNSDYGKFREDVLKVGVTNTYGAQQTAALQNLGVGTAYNGTPYVNLYAVWDMGPAIEAYDRYYTLEEAQRGFITEDELLNAAKATDEEVKSDSNPEGRLKNHADEENHTSFEVYDYQAEEFTGLHGSAVISVTYHAEDAAGNVTKKMILVHIVDGHDTVIDGYDIGREPDEGEVRFISEKYLDTLDEDSIWVTDAEYAKLLKETVSIKRVNPKRSEPVDLLKAFGDKYTVAIPGTGTWTKEPKYVWNFTHEQKQEVKKFIEEHGPSNFVEEDALEKFLEEFDKCRIK